jgi:hypothetical protein
LDRLRTLSDILCFAADGVVKYENSRCSRSVVVESDIVPDFYQQRTCHLRILKQLLGFRIIISSDLVVILEIFFDTLMWIDLESVAVQSITIFITTDVVDDDLLSYVWPDISFWLAAIDMSGWGIDFDTTAETHPT